MYRGRGRRWVAPLERAIGLHWWNGSSIRREKFGAFLRSNSLSCDVAYVVVANEENAAQALSLLDVLDRPYVVHLMDLAYDRALDVDAMPAFGRLLRGATSLIALSAAIAIAVEPFGGPKAQIIPFGHVVLEDLARWPAERVMRIAMVGKPYPGGLDLIAQAWPEISEAFRQLSFRVELAYVGQHSHALPQSLRRDLNDFGYVADDGDLHRVLKECQFAYLSGPSEDDQFARYSIPSRIADFLMAGLPTVACVAPNCATETFLAPLVSDSVRITRTPGELRQAFEGFIKSRESWEYASRKAREFAIEHLSMDKVRGSILSILQHAAAGHTAESPREQHFNY